VQKTGKRNRAVFTEKVEVYRLGVFFYFLLTGEYPFRHEEEGIRSPRTVKKWLLEGRIPALPQHIDQSDDLALQALVNLTRQAMSVDSETRPNARQLADSFDELSKELT
jgi:serine/threonine protein kinase